MKKWLEADRKKLFEAMNLVSLGHADRIDLKELNVSVYKCGTVLRVDHKSIFEA